MCGSQRKGILYSEKSSWLSPFDPCISWWIFILSPILRIWSHSLIWSTVYTNIKYVDLKPKNILNSKFTKQKILFHSCCRLGVYMSLLHVCRCACVFDAIQCDECHENVSCKKSWLKIKIKWEYAMKCSGFSFVHSR